MNKLYCTCQFLPFSLSVLLIPLYVQRKANLLYSQLYIPIHYICIIQLSLSSLVCESDLLINFFFSIFSPLFSISLVFSDYIFLTPSKLRDTEKKEWSYQLHCILLMQFPKAAKITKNDLTTIFFWF